MAALAPIAVGASLIGGVIGAAGAMQEGEAKAAAARQNAAIQRYNQQVALRNRGVVSEQGHADVAEKVRSNERTLSTIRAAYGASGLALDGSPLDAISDTAKEQSLDVQKIRYKSTVQMAGYTDEANNYAMKAQLDEMNAQYAEDAAPFNAASQFLGGVTKGASFLRAA